MLAEGRYVTLPAASKLISKQIEVFSARRYYDSDYYLEASNAVCSGSFKGISLGDDNGKQPEISKGQFYQALADAMASRLLSESDKELTRAVELIYLHFQMICRQSLENLMSGSWALNLA